jgi:hypothetical protein
MQLPVQQHGFLIPSYFLSPQNRGEKEVKKPMPFPRPESEETFQL